MTARSQSWAANDEILADADLLAAHDLELPAGFDPRLVKWGAVRGAPTKEDGKSPGFPPLGDLGWPRQPPPCRADRY
jgi:hypothetical protein